MSVSKLHYRLQRLALFSYITDIDFGVTIAIPVLEPGVKPYEGSVLPITPYSYKRIGKESNLHSPSRENLVFKTSATYQ